MSEGLREVSTPLLVDPEGRTNVTDLVIERFKLAPEHTAFTLAGPEDRLVDVTTAAFYCAVTDLAKGLIAAGVRAGDRIAVQGKTSYAWAVADLAALWAGAIVVPIFDTAAKAQVEFITQDASIKWAFADTAEQRQLLAAQGTANVWDLAADTVGESDLVRLGRAVSAGELEARRVATQLDDIATLVYTSGTDGEPKGVILTHRNLVGQVLNVGADYSQLVNDAGRTLIFLPLAHVLARGLLLICLAGGMAVSFESDPKQAVASLARLRPTFLVVVPRVLQKIRERVGANADAKHLGWLWRRAERVAIQRGSELQQGQAGETPRPSVAHRLFDRLFFHRVRELFGGELRYILSGAAPLGTELSLLFRGMGLEVIEGYGLTETTAPLTGNRVGDNYAGTVGRPEPGHTVRISEQGEVLAKGVGVTRGYWNDRDNAEAFVDGFLRTGDLGTLDDAGRLRITGRIKDVIVTAGGKNMSPLPWQQTVEADALVAHAVVVGDSRPYLAALILVDDDELERLGMPATASTSPEPVAAEAIIDRVRRAIQAANERVSMPEQIKRFSIWRADLRPGADWVTPSMKLRRSQVLASMASAVEQLYRQGHQV